MSGSEAKSQNGSIGEQIGYDDFSIEVDNMLRSEKSAVSKRLRKFWEIDISTQNQWYSLTLRKYC